MLFVHVSVKGEGESWSNKHASVIRILVTLDYLFGLLFRTENQYFICFAKWDAQRQALKMTCYS